MYDVRINRIFSMHTIKKQTTSEISVLCRSKQSKQKVKKNLLQRYLGHVCRQYKSAFLR